MKDSHILVTGGAGYIGSHTCKALAAAGLVPVTLDSLSRGHRTDVRWGPFFEGDIQDRALVSSLIDRFQIRSAIHFAAFAYVGESIQEPRLYYENNSMKSMALVHALLDSKVKQLVFSSTCATYGIPKSLPIDEEHVQDPINPYGRSKLFIEQVLADYARAYGMQSVALRYFNAAGADPDCELQEVHSPETHLIPLAIDAALNENFVLEVFGDDYQTADGTCERDYIHVADIASAHLRALKYLGQKDSAEGVFEAVNLGTGRAFSVRQIIDTVSKVVGKPVKYRVSARRPGDPGCLVAAPAKAGKLLGWQPRYLEIEEIVRTAVAARGRG